MPNKLHSVDLYSFDAETHHFSKNLGGQFVDEIKGRVAALVGLVQSDAVLRLKVVTTKFSEAFLISNQQIVSLLQLIGRGGLCFGDHVGQACAPANAGLPGFRCHVVLSV
jgi:hypothetical protein